MANAESTYTLNIRVDDNGNVQAQIEGINKGFQTIQKSLSELRKEAKTRDLYGNYISELKKVRDQTATTWQETEKFNRELRKLEQQQTRTFAKRGSLEWYNLQHKQLREQQRTLATTDKAWLRYEKRIAEVKKKVDNLTNSQTLNKRSNKDMVSTAGLGSATLVEFGRTVSDSNYGIQGMANNLTQLSNLFITFQAKSGGVKNAFQQLGRQIMGPQGIILGLTLLITLWERYSMSQERSAREAKKSGDQFLASQSILLSQVDALDDVNTSEEERYAITENLKEAIPGLTDADLEYGANLDKVREKIVEYTLAQANRAEMDKLQEQNQELLVKRNRLAAIREIEDADKRFEAFKKLQEEFQVFSQGDLEKLVTNGMSTYIKRLEGDELRERYEELTQDVFDESDKVLKKINDLAGSTGAVFTKSTEETKKKHSSLLQNLIREEELLYADQYEKDRLKADNAYEDAKAKAQKEFDDKIITQEQYDQALLIAKRIHDKAYADIDQEKWDDEIKRMESAFKDQQALRKSFEKRRKDDSKESLSDIQEFISEETYARKFAVAQQITDKKEQQKEFKKIQIAMLQMELELITAGIQSGNLLEEDVKKRVLRIKDQILNLGGEDVDKELSPEQKKKRILDSAKKTLDAVESAFQAQYDAEISREEAKTAKINNELKKRLANENLSAKQKEALNNQIAANESALQTKRDEIAEKNFKTQKALSVANAIMSTYEAADKAMTSLPTPLSFIAAAATVTAGLLNVQSILNQQFVPSSATVRTGGLNGSSIQPPDFNIVGASGTSQLAQVVSGQMDKPVKAYIVAKDVSTAQEMDRNKVEAASL